MKEKIKNIFQGPLIYYPLLFAIFPILFLYSHNVRETPIDQIFLPMIISLVFTIIIWVILYFILRSVPKAGLAVLVFLIIFFAYGHFYDFLNNLNIFIPDHIYLFPILLIVFCICVYLIKRIQKNLSPVSTILNITGIILILINLFNIGYYKISNYFSDSAESANVEQLTGTGINSGKTEAMPDIYLIFLDEYAHPDTMRDYYDYDNSQFIDSMKEKGFYIADKSRTHSGSTELCMSSVLNFEYINTSKEEAFKKLVNNNVVDFLKLKNYKYIYFGTQHDSGRYFINADIRYNFYEKGSLLHSLMVSEFSQILRNTTMLRPFDNNISDLFNVDSYHRESITYTLEMLKKVPEIDSPKFILAHIMCPHEPFVFGPNGEKVNPENASNFKDKQYYLGQYIYISKEISKVADAILEKSTREPIIIIQSDHGLRPERPGLNIGKEDWRKILNAYYLPGSGKEMLYNSISPVNSFRLIFNYYFNTDYKLLDDEQ